MYRLLSRQCRWVSNTFLEKKLAKQSEVDALRMKPKTPLVELKLPMTSMVPGFFSKQLLSRMTKNIEVNKPNTNIPSNSYAQIKLGLSTDGYFNMIFQRLTSKYLRVGRMLQVMDSAAGIAAYRYAHGQVDLNVDFIMATACVDEIEIYEEMQIEKDLTVSTYVTFVGKTSLEVQVDVEQEGRLKASALFTMVARQKSNQTKSYPVPEINLVEEPDMPNAKIRFQRGVKNRQLRIESAKKQFDQSVPEKQEMEMLMKVFRNTDPSKPSIKMKHTVAQKSILMHTQDRNVQGKIFGGYLMRQMIQLAWFSCMKVSNGREVAFQDIQNVNFHEPVEVGNGLIVRSIVSFVDDCRLVVKVVASKLKFETQKLVKTCEVHIIFKTVDNSVLPPVIPQTFEQGMTYIIGKRKLDNLYS